MTEIIMLVIGVIIGALLMAFVYSHEREELLRHIDEMDETIRVLEGKNRTVMNERLQKKVRFVSICYSKQRN